jgi:GTP pyrophosphokinase
MEAEHLKYSGFEQLLEEIPSLSGAALSRVRGCIKALNECLERNSEPKTEDILAAALGIARIASIEIGLGHHTLMAAILLALPEAELSDKKLNSILTKEAKSILTGYRKIQAIRTERTEYQSENFIKLLLTVADDIRSILLQLSSKLFHLRHCQSLSREKSQLLAREVAFLYAPVAHRLGLYRIKAELEDKAMQIMEPEAYQHIAKQLSDSATKQKAYIQDFLRPIDKVLIANEFSYETKWRAKSIPSIWDKMKKQGVDFEQVYDVFAIRIILDKTLESEKADCWKVYSLVTDIYPPEPDRLRDWVSSPRPNGYESLHTTVFGPGKRWVEVQIRTRRMDDIAEKGHAAHWQYKDKKADLASAAWLKSIREMLAHPQADAFQRARLAKTDLYSDKIFVFTPNGDLRKLPAGASVLDFAFEIHTRIGSECTGAKVNGKNVSIRHKLQNGDVVEIQTSKNQRPKSDWLGFVVSTKARIRIRRAMKEAQHQEAATGREMLERKLKSWKCQFNDENISKIIKHLKYKDSIELYAAVAAEKVDLKAIKLLLTEAPKDTNGGNGTQPAMEALLRPVADSGETGGDVLEVDKDIRKLNFSLASCCNPIFGDDIFGFVTVSKGITIHRVSCPNAADLTERYPYRIIKARWKNTSENSSYIATIRISGKDKMGIVNTISEVISNEMKVNMRSLSFESEGGRFSGIISVNVLDTRHLEALLRKLQKIDGISKASRAD